MNVTDMMQRFGTINPQKDAPCKVCGFEYADHSEATCPYEGRLK